MSLTWFAKMNSIDDLHIGGSVLSQYFDSGDGTQASPFVITRPKHWENLVWLHNNVSNFYQAIADGENNQGQQNDQGYYFQVGKEAVTGSGNYYVYDYLDTGLINPSNTTLSSTTLNLKGLGSLIPIGCDTKPFLGVINGHGITVSGFEVVGFEDKNYNLQHDSGELGFNDVGIFGYIGNDSAVNDIYFNNFTIHLADANAYRSNNTELHNNTFHASVENGSPDTVFAGYIAGHMHYSSSVNRVYINNCTIDGGTAALSGFGYFGVVENQNGEIKLSPLEDIQQIKQAGQNNNFGGSIDMYGVFERLYNIVANAKSSYGNNNNPINGVTGYNSYVSSETIIKNTVSGTEEIFDQQRTTSNTWASSSTSPRVTYIEATTDWGGEFNFASDNFDGSSGLNGSNNIYEALFGTSSHYKKTVTTYTFTDSTYQCFFIQNGDKYLNHRYYANLQAVTDENYAAGWRFTGNNTGNLYTKVFDVTYYLNRTDYTLSLSTTATTTWTKTSDDEIYTNINGAYYYIDYDENYPSKWILSPYKDRYLIDDGNGHYINANNGSISSTSSDSNATKWFLTNANGDTSIGFMYNNTPYYLVNNNENLTLSTTPVTWSKDTNNNSYYVTIQGTKFYLVFENNNWFLRPESAVRLSNNGNNYLNSTNNSTVSNLTNANTVYWQFSSDTGDTQIYYIYNGQKYYLCCNGELYISQGVSGTTWHRDGNALYYSVGNYDYYLTYNNGWKVTELMYYLIHDSNNNYLVASGSNSFSNGNVSQATHFYFSNTNGSYPTGTINYVYNNVVYYLTINFNGAASDLISSTSSGIEWSNDGNSIYYVNGEYTFYLDYDTVWDIKLIVADAFRISDDNLYMVVSGTTITSTTNQRNASVFIFSNTNGSYPTGTIRVLGTTNSFLTKTDDNVLEINTSSTIWSNNGTNLYITSNSTNYYLIYSGGWRLSNSRTGYSISFNGYYLGVQENSSTTIETTQFVSTLWSSNIDFSGDGTATIQPLGSNYYLYANETSNSQLQVNGTTRSWTFYKTYNILYFTDGSYIYFIILDSNNNFAIKRNGKNSNGRYPIDGNYNLTYESRSISSYARALTNTTTGSISSKTEVTKPSITITNYTASKNGRTTYNSAKDYSTVISGKELQECQKTIQNNVNSGSPTYFPLRVDKTNNAFPSGYTVSDLNTGYIVSGANLTTANDEYQRQFGDIRVSGFTTSTYIADSYSNGNFTHIYTVDDDEGSNTVRELTSSEYADKNYQATMNDLKDAINTRVYGLHFMDATISTSNTIRAKNAKILGKTYTNYELPQDSIDFNVYEKGEISFVAGNYFTNNNTFFSLHRIYRDSNNDIENIYEIEAIYWHATRKGKANYIYKFTNGTYTDKNGKYTGATTLDQEYDTNPIFKTSWITSPNNLTGISNHILFYFTIPCNAGEYALGSTGTGKIGAYLCYLDIAANGGDSLLDKVRDPDKATTFSVDYRSSVSSHNHCLIEIGAQFQSSANKDNLKITVSFDNNPTTVNGTEYANGIYIIHVTNLTGAVFRLSVMLIDDNDDLTDDFEYAYKIIYTNQTYEDQVIMGTKLFDSEQTPVPYWKRMAIFDIPTTGAAGEIDYTQD